MKRYVRAQEESSLEDRLNDKISRVKDDFDFAVAGIEKLVADGQMDDAQSALDDLDASLNEIISIVSSNIAE